MTRRPMQQGPLWTLDAASLIRGYASGAFTPDDALEAIHTRLHEANGAINAVIAEDCAAARAAAMRSTRRWREGSPLSQLDGAPLTVKDNLFVAGLPATWGSAAYENFRPGEDEPAIARLRAAGAVILGKTNVPEFAVQGYTTNALFGTTGNPIAPGRTPGGSTGGGAAAVAAGFGSIAIGTDGGGSVRRPAAHCGLFGMKPSIGQIARYGGFRQILADFEVIGPLARSLADLQSAFTIMRGADARDPRSLAAEAPRRPFGKTVRIGYFSGVGAAPVDPEISVACERFAASLSDSGFDLTRIAAPFEIDHIHHVWGAIASAGLAWEVDKLGERARFIGENAKAMAERGRACALGDYIEALAEVGQVRAQAAPFFERFDCLLCPSTAALAWLADEAFPCEIDGTPVGPRGHAIFTGWMNVAGLCAVNVPIASGGAGGGIGIQFVAASGRDLDLLDFLSASLAPDALGPVVLHLN